MIDVAVSTTINRPVEAVFAYVTDLSNDPAWHTDMLEVRQTSAGPVGPGTTFEVRIKPFMGVSTGTIEVVGFEPGRSQMLQGVMGPMRPRVTTRFEPAGGGTQVTRQVQLQPTGLMKLMQPVMASMMRKRNAGFLANLKRVLETSLGNPVDRREVDGLS